MFQPTRNEARNLYREAWRKYRAGELVEPIESIALQQILEHPEYHDLLADPNSHLYEWDPDSGESNPFLHLSLHVAIAEQLSIDQPTGIRNHYETLCARLGNQHGAQHLLMECLIEMLWQSQRSGQAPDVAAYMECIERQARG